MKTVIYLGSFDPPTPGDLNIIHRCARMFGNLTVGVLDREYGRATFMSQTDRIVALKRQLFLSENVEILPACDSPDALIKAHQIQVVIRCLRFSRDLEREMQFASAVKRNFPQLELLYMIPDEGSCFLTSDALRAVSQFSTAGKRNPDQAPSDFQLQELPE